MHMGHTKLYFSLFLDFNVKFWFELCSIAKCSCNPAWHWWVLKKNMFQYMYSKCLSAVQFLSYMVAIWCDTYFHCNVLFIGKCSCNPALHWWVLKKNMSLMSPMSEIAISRELLGSSSLLVLSLLHIMRLEHSTAAKTFLNIPPPPTHPPTQPPPTGPNKTVILFKVSGHSQVTGQRTLFFNGTSVCIQKTLLS